MQVQNEAETPTNGDHDGDARHRPDKVEDRSGGGTAVDEPIPWRMALSLAGLLLGDVFRRARANVLGILLLNIIGVATRAASLGAMILYVEAQTSGESIALGPIVMPSDAKPTSLLLWGPRVGRSTPLERV